ncbi:hypothetical protein HZC09_06350 [Candidatus Micrarchaeota archaeon]|nr:hypothetical protein [Candidatus Micrarchaeota archaeon]
MTTRLERLLTGRVGRVVLHIGPGGGYPGTPSGIDILPRELHICFESNPCKDTEFKKLRRISTKGKPILNVFSFPRVFQEMALPAAFANEIHLLSAPYPLKLSDVKLQPSGPTQSVSLLQKVWEALKPDGVAYIAHTLTPNVFPKKKLERLAKQIGFSVEFLAEDRRKDPLETPLVTPRELGLFAVHVGKSYGEWAHRWYNLEHGYFLAKLTKKAG